MLSHCQSQRKTKIGKRKRDTIPCHYSLRLIQTRAGGANCSRLSLCLATPASKGIFVEEIRETFSWTRHHRRLFVNFLPLVSSTLDPSSIDDYDHGNSLVADEGTPRRPVISSAREAWASRGAKTRSSKRRKQVERVCVRPLHRPPFFLLSCPSVHPRRGLWQHNHRV